MLSNRGKYGLKALAHLAGAEGHLVTGAEIARVDNIPKKFLDAILNDLKRAGLIHAQKGPRGGYALARPASEITAGEAIRVIDGALAPIACASRNFYRPCSDCDVATCRVRLLMVQARDAMATILDGTTLVDLRALGSKQRRALGLPKTKAAGRKERVLVRA
ncbi:MAG: Rrf2 family transcriptional regulator [Bauldia sp.]|nr:Rrf2 family transcriptional regulator [Bauldia sp.]